MRLPLGNAIPGWICFEAVHESFLSGAEGEISPTEVKIMLSSAVVVWIWTSMWGEVAWWQIGLHNSNEYRFKLRGWFTHICHQEDCGSSNLIFPIDSFLKSLIYHQLCYPSPPSNLRSGDTAPSNGTGLPPFLLEYSHTLFLIR
jgi:hypothetical protein